MPNPISKPIIGAFEDIGEQIVSQVKQLPKDVGQAAMESVGLSTGSGKQGAKAPTSPTPGATQDSGSKWQEIDKTNDEKVKREIARAALEELNKPSTKPKEPSIWEKIQQEEAQKKEAQKQQQHVQAKTLPMPTGKKKTGMYGIKAKQQGSEIGKNVKSD